jgi:hypothetical protein
MEYLHEDDGYLGQWEFGFLCMVFVVESDGIHTRRRDRREQLDDLQRLPHIERERERKRKGREGEKESMKEGDDTSVWVWNVLAAEKIFWSTNGKAFRGREDPWRHHERERGREKERERDRRVRRARSRSAVECSSVRHKADQRCIQRMR